MDLHDEWLSSTRKYIKFDQWETGKTLYSILHRIMDLTEKYLTDLIDNRNNELMRQNIARFLTKLVSEWKSIISQNMDKLRY